jgi:hypothetical protein
MAIAHITGKPSGSMLLTPAQLAERLAVPSSWVKEKTRQRARERDADPLPVVQLGKYTRFCWEDVQAWIERQKR